LPRRPPFFYEGDAEMPRSLSLTCGVVALPAGTFVLRIIMDAASASTNAAGNFNWMRVQ
jgi:hypothetical protein